MKEMLPKIYELISAFGMKFIAALFILIIGKIIASSIKKILLNMLKKKNVDSSISSFVASLTYGALWIFVILAALSQLGIQTTSFMAVIGAAGLAIGLALQGSLSNFAAGFLIILFRPFKVGDYVNAGGQSGSISKITIFTTEFHSVDNKKIVVPNSKIMNDNIINYSAEDTRRVDLSFGVGYESDVKKVHSIIDSVIAKHDLILKEPPPFVRLGKLNDSSLDFTVRVWVKTADYWTVYFDLIETVKEEFDKHKINIPFPQMDVHIKNR